MSVKGLTLGRRRHTSPRSISWWHSSNARPLGRATDAARYQFCSATLSVRGYWKHKKKDAAWRVGCLPAYQKVGKLNCRTTDGVSEVIEASKARSINLNKSGRSLLHCYWTSTLEQPMSPLPWCWTYPWNSASSYRHCFADAWWLLLSERLTNVFTYLLP